MHYRGMLRVTRRDKGVRLYAPPRLAAQDERALSPSAKAAALLELALAKYAPVPAIGLRQLASRLQHGAPQLAVELRAALKRAQAQLPHQVVDGVAWYWPADEDPRRIGAGQGADGVRFLAPFDPVVWDRGRFESFWGWTYRFEAYTPQRRRKLGYYAMPVLWRDDVVGWVNLAMQAGALAVDLGFAAGRAPAHRNFRRELDAEVERVREFLHAP